MAGRQFKHRFGRQAGQQFRDAATAVSGTQFVSRDVGRLRKQQMLQRRYLWSVTPDALLQYRTFRRLHAGTRATDARLLQHQDVVFDAPVLFQRTFSMEWVQARVKDSTASVAASAPAARHRGISVRRRVPAASAGQPAVRPVRSQSRQTTAGRRPAVPLTTRRRHAPTQRVSCASGQWWPRPTA